MRFLVVNGPNLNLLGMREPEVYGSTTLADLEEQVTAWGEEVGAAVETGQWNGEEGIIEAIHGFEGDGIVINPGAFTHTSRAIADALRAVETPAVEVHISNIHDREPWRARSVVADACVRTIFGRGIGGYRNAMRHLVNRAATPFETISYGPHRDNVGDLRRGDGHLVVLAHGGLWKQEFERDLMESLAVDLAERGHSTWNIEYRRVGAGGGWPASAHDALTALDFIPQLGVDVTRVTLVTHSVGSQLLMWAAPRAAVTPGLHVALGPLVDLGAAIESDDVGATECRAMLEQGAPSSLEPGGIATVLIHGDDDQIIPVERTVAFAEKHALEHHRTGCDHFSLLDPSKPEWSWTLDRIGSGHELAG